MTRRRTYPDGVTSFDKYWAWLCHCMGLPLISDLRLPNLPDVAMPGCQPRHIVAYFNAVTSLVAQLNLTIDDDERVEQRLYYRKVVSTTVDLLDGKKRSAPRE